MCNAELLQKERYFEEGIIDEVPEDEFCSVQ
jgi:hypothetical protein